jgi:hypothetical protein
MALRANMFVWIAHIIQRYRKDSLAPPAAATRVPFSRVSARSTAASVALSRFERGTSSGKSKLIYIL